MSGKRCFEVHVFHSRSNGFSVFFEAELIDENEDDIISEAVNQGKLESDDMEHVDYANEIERDEYNDAVCQNRNKN